MAEFVSTVDTPASSRSRRPVAWWPPRLGRSERVRSSGVDEPPLRSEIFTADQMAQHGKALAASHAVGPRRGPDQLLPRLASNEAALIGVCRLLTAALTEGRRIAPAGEWLLDNFYLIEEQIRSSRLILPRNYSLELPRLGP